MRKSNKVEILRISSFYGLFLPPFARSTYLYTPHARKRRFFLKSAYPLYQTEEAVSNAKFEAASFYSKLLDGNHGLVPHLGGVVTKKIYGSSGYIGKTKISSALL